MAKVPVSRMWLSQIMTKGCFSCTWALNIPPIPSRGHDDFTISQHLGRLRPGLPPNHMILDAVQFAESPPHAFIGREFFKNLLRGNPVSHQGKFQICCGSPEHASSPRILFQVEEVPNGSWERSINEFRIEGDDGGIYKGAHSAVGQHSVKEILGCRCPVRSGRKLQIVHILEQPLITTRQQRGALGVDDVPMDRPGIDLGAYLGQPAVVVFQLDSYARFFGKGFVVAFDTGPGIGPAEENHCQGLLCPSQTGRAETRNSPKEGWQKYDSFS